MLNKKTIKVKPKVGRFCGISIYFVLACPSTVSDTQNITTGLSLVTISNAVQHTPAYSLMDSASGVEIHRQKAKLVRLELRKAAT